MPFLVVFNIATEVTFPDLLMLSESHIEMLSAGFPQKVVLEKALPSKVVF